MDSAHLSVDISQTLSTGCYAQERPFGCAAGPVHFLKTVSCGDNSRFTDNLPLPSLELLGLLTRVSSGSILHGCPKFPAAETLTLALDREAKPRLQAGGTSASVPVLLPSQDPVNSRCMQASLSSPELVDFNRD